MFTFYLKAESVMKLTSDAIDLLHSDRSVANQDPFLTFQPPITAVCILYFINTELLVQQKLFDHSICLKSLHS